MRNGLQRWVILGTFVVVSAAARTTARFLKLFAFWQTVT